MAVWRFSGRCYVDSQGLELPGCGFEWFMQMIQLADGVAHSAHRIAIRYTFVAALAGLVSSCGHPADARLESAFYRSQSNLTKLTYMAKEDDLDALWITKHQISPSRITLSESR